MFFFALLQFELHYSKVLKTRHRHHHFVEHSRKNTM